MTDHAFYTAECAIGQAQVMQVLWIYEHAIDIEGLKRFHHNLAHGILGRRIERSPLPFARSRWVSAPARPDIAIADCPRPRSSVSDWADERSQLPTDPESTSGWHLAVLPLEDGATAVSLVVSHSLLDGLGLAAALADAVLGNTRDLGLPPSHSRTRLRAVAQDARQTAKDLPEARPAIAAAARMARHQRRDIAAAARSARLRRRDTARLPAPRRAASFGGDRDQTVIVPAIAIYVDLDDWNARAKALGGTSNALVAGLAAKLGEHLGRRRAEDGAVTLQLPMSDRGEDDTRANAMWFARVTVDPTQVTSDLSHVRASIKEALGTMRGTSADSPFNRAMSPAALGIVWLTQFAPRRALNRLLDVQVGDPDLPVFCSNIGDLGMVVCRLDGTDAEYAYGRAVIQGVTREFLERTGGLMRMQCWRVGGKVGITLVAYQPGAENTKPALRELAARTLADFDLTGEID